MWKGVEDDTRSLLNDVCECFDDVMMLENVGRMRVALHMLMLFCRHETECTSA